MRPFSHPHGRTQKRRRPLGRPRPPPRRRRREFYDCGAGHGAVPAPPAAAAAPRLRARSGGCPPAAAGAHRRGGKVSPDRGCGGSRRSRPLDPASRRALPYLGGLRRRLGHRCFFCREQLRRGAGGRGGGSVPVLRGGRLGGAAGAHGAAPRPCGAAGGGWRRAAAAQPGMKEPRSPQTPLGSDRRGGKKKKLEKEEKKKKRETEREPARKITSSPGPPARLPLAPSHEQSPGHALQHQIGLIRSGQGGQRPAHRPAGRGPLLSRARPVSPGWGRRPAPGPPRRHRGADSAFQPPPRLHWDESPLTSTLGGSSPRAEPPAQGLSPLPGRAAPHPQIGFSQLLPRGLGSGAPSLQRQGLADLCWAWLREGRPDFS